MRLLVLCALVIGVGILLLVGFLVMAQELFADSVFGVPPDPGEETERGCMGESAVQSRSPNNDNN